MDNLKFAIIGFGKMGQIRYKTIIEDDRCDVKLICEKVLTKKFPSNVRITQDINEILADKEINAVFICTSNDVLKDYVIASLNSGKHVFCEKPPGRNLTELKEMIEAEYKRPDLKLMFGFNHRHHESIIHAKKEIDSGEYGNVLWMRGRYGKSYDNNFFSNWRSKKEIAGGGIFLDQGIHMLDLFLMICDDFDEVKAFVSNLYWKLDVEDNVFAIFRNKKGQVASLHSTTTQWRHLFSFEIFMEKGYITINGLKTSSNTYGEEAMSIAKNRTTPPAAKWTLEDDITFHVDSSWRRELDIFVAAIKENKKIPVGNTNDALKLMRIVDKIYKKR